MMNEESIIYTCIHSCLHVFIIDNFFVWQSLLFNQGYLRFEINHFYLRYNQNKFDYK